jgi:dCMP deaminase
MLLNNKWDYRFGEMAQLISSWSKDPSTQVGAVIVRPNKSIASLGYNGFPPGVEDRPEWLLDRTKKLELMVHAEHNALNFCDHENITTSTIYVYPLHPCAKCAKRIFDRGVTTVVTVTTQEKHDYMSQPEVWARYAFDQTFALFDAFEIKYRTIII